jgi:hypothetical protein
LKKEAKTFATTLAARHNTIAKQKSGIEGDRYE